MLLLLLLLQTGDNGALTNLTSIGRALHAEVPIS
jgi:hypothetical protein